MRHLWRRIRTNWNTTDTVVAVSNTLALALLIGNCWWESVAVTYTALAASIGTQLWRARRDRTLRDALVFGAVVGGLWPIGEWCLVNTLGWWGSYIAPSIRVLVTPPYCMLVGVLASAHCLYVSRRAIDLGYGTSAAVFACGTAAFFLGIIGENLFVAGRMWVYHPSPITLGHVPAFVPIGYGLGYAVAPLLRRFPPVAAALLFCIILPMIIVPLGLLAGFFPR